MNSGLPQPSTSNTQSEDNKTKKNKKPADLNLTLNTKCEGFYKPQIQWERASIRILTPIEEIPSPKKFTSNAKKSQAKDQPKEDL